MVYLKQCKFAGALLNRLLKISEFNIRSGGVYYIKTRMKVWIRKQNIQKEDALAVVIKKVYNQYSPVRHLLTMGYLSNKNSGRVYQK